MSAAYAGEDNESAVAAARIDRRFISYFFVNFLYKWFLSSLFFWLHLVNRYLPSGFSAVFVSQEITVPRIIVRGRRQGRLWRRRLDSDA